MLKLRKWLPLLFSAAAGLAAAAFLKPDVFADVSGELMAMFGLMMAAVLPTMILTASTLRAGNLPSTKIDEYRDALLRQLSIWFGLFVLSLGASLFTILGGMSKWKLEISLPAQLQPYLGTTYDLAHVLTGLIVFCLALILTRAPQVARGIRSLLVLSADISKSEALEREEKRSAEIVRTMTAIPDSRKDFGAVITSDRKSKRVG